jgi:microcystin-dependent protein
MANYAQTSKNFTGQFMTGIQGVNTGIIVPWGSASIPSGFLECNGQSVSQVTYAALFAVIGTTYGNPGGGNFNVPDLTDRTVVNKSNNKNLASTGGANTVTPTGNVSLTVGDTTIDANTLAAHTHTMINIGLGPQFGVFLPGTGVGSGTLGNAGTGGSHTHTVSSPTFSGSASSVLQPYITMVYIIKT